MANDTKPTGTSTNDDAATSSLASWGDTVVTWGSALGSWGGGSLATNDTKPTGSSANDIKP